MKQLATDKMVAADEELKIETESLAKLLLPITDPKKQGGTFNKRLFVYNNPKINIIVGGSFQLLAGLIGPVFGIFIIKTLFAMINNPYDLALMRKDVNFWCLLMFLGSIVTLILIFISKKSFSVVAENITKNVRADLYLQILKKHVGWHDDQENASGVLSATLASDV